jgi:uncharacterized membrane protein YjjP (DUF1212 family)
MENIQKIKPNSEALAEIVDLMLWTGQLLIEYGADSQRVERNVTRLGIALGCENIDMFISHGSLMITTSYEGGFRTKIRRVKRHGVNFTIISAISKMSWRVLRQNLDKEVVKEELHRISKIGSHYPRWLVILMVGLACGAFSRLFGGDWITFAFTTMAAAVGVTVRQELTKKAYNLFLIILASASSASLVAGTAYALNWADNPSTILAASVLFLVPGVPMINSVKDMMDGFTMVGLTRAIIGALISLCIAVGLIAGMTILNIKAF